MKLLKRKWHARKEGWKYRFLPPLVDKLVDLTNHVPKKKIATADAGRILIDNSVLGHSVTHETAWVDTGKKLWGGEIEIETGYTARIPVHSEEDDSDVARSVRFLPSIARLAKTGGISLFQSMELGDERLTQPMGRYSGYGLFDHSLFSDVSIETLEDADYSLVFGPSGTNVPSVKEQRQKRLAKKSDPLFQSLLAILGKNNSQDAYHIAVAEREDFYCFLTMDFTLVRSLTAQKNNQVIRSLKTKVMTPETYGISFGLMSVSPRLMSYHNASYPVLSGENWPDSKRQRPRSRNSSINDHND